MPRSRSPQPCQRFINIAGNTLSFPCRQQNQSVVDWLDSLIDLIEVQVQSQCIKPQLLLRCPQLLVYITALSL